MIQTSHVVTAAAFDTPWLHVRAAELAEPWALHRKLWEFAVIAQVYHERIGRGGRVLGFGVGQEPLPAWFAAQGATVLATDRADDTAEWTATGQHAASAEALWRPFVPREVFDAAVSFRPVDMNDIPEDLQTGAYDLVWSAGSLEHLGSIASALLFIARTLRCVRRGGWVVHTTELELDPTGPLPCETPTICLLRRDHLAALANVVAALGATLWPLALTPGSSFADRIIDRPPYGLPHLRLQLGPWVTTSVVLIATNGPEALGVPTV